MRDMILRGHEIRWVGITGVILAMGPFQSAWTEGFFVCMRSERQGMTVYKAPREGGWCSIILDPCIYLFIRCRADGDMIMLVF